MRDGRGSKKGRKLKRKKGERKGVRLMCANVSISDSGFFAFL